MHLTCVCTDCQNCDSESFYQLFTVNICKLQNFISNSPRLEIFADRLAFDSERTSEYDVHWHFIMCNIQLLKLLCRTSSELTQICDTLSPGCKHSCAGTNPETSAPPLSSDALSVSHRKAVSSALQFISVFGISPLLLPGVGIPLHLRSQLAGRLVTKDVTSCLSNCDKYCHLAACIGVLIDCLHQPALASVILSVHICDLLASLIQVCYSPVWKTYAAEAVETRTDLVGMKYVDELTKLINELPTATLVRELLLLQSGYCPPNMKVRGFYIMFYAVA